MDKQHQVLHKMLYRARICTTYCTNELAQQKVMSTVSGARAQPTLSQGRGAAPPKSSALLHTLDKPR